MPPSARLVGLLDTDVGVGVTVGSQVLLLVLAFYALTTLRAGSIARWAGKRTLGSLGLLFPLVTRALPLLLLFITFLFINTEVWMVAARLDGARDVADRAAVQRGRGRVPAGAAAGGDGDLRHATSTRPGWCPAASGTPARGRRGVVRRRATRRTATREEHIGGLQKANLSWCC